MLSDAILSYSLTGITNVSYAENFIHRKDLLRHLRTIQGRENVRMSSLPNNTVRKDHLTSHRRVHTTELALNGKQNTSEAQLSQV